MSPAAAAANRLKHWLVVRAPLPMTQCSGPRLSRAFGILVYHRVAPHVRGAPRPTWNVTPRQLRSQLGGLLSRGYVAWPLRKVLEAHRQGNPIPRCVFVVTFDDGYANNYQFALPILKQLNVPATIFLATGYLDSKLPFPFDDWEGAGKASVDSRLWRPLTSEQCDKLLGSSLIELGAHTHTHCDFRRHPDHLTEDLGQCVDVLSRRFGVTQPTFAFPYGRRDLGFSSPPLSNAARAAGVCCALTTEQELVTPASDPFDWGRFTAASVDNAATLAAKLDGWYSWLRETGRHLAGVPSAAQHSLAERVSGTAS